MLKFRLSEFLDKLILMVAMLVFLLVGVSSIRSSSELNEMSSRKKPLLSDMKTNVKRFEVKPVVADHASWETPQAQSRGDDWIFDIFTPPVIYYNPSTQAFTVTPPDFSNREKGDMWANFDIELLEVRPRPYRLQLVGYAGEPGNYVAYFEYLPTGEMLLAKQGKLLVEAGVRVASFEVKQMEVEQEGSMPVFENVGIARLKDFESGEEIFLTNLETKIYSDLEAKFRARQNGNVYLVREGSQVELEDHFYIIGDLSTVPEEAMVTKISRDGIRRQSRLLTPSSNDGALNEGDPSERNSPFAIRPQAPIPGPQG